MLILGGTGSASIIFVLFPQVSKCNDPFTQFGSDCNCFEDNTAYRGHKINDAKRNMQPSRSACQKSCAKHPRCTHWTWAKRGAWCSLKSGRAGVLHGRTRFVSGSKDCLLPEDEGESCENGPDPYDFCWHKNK